MLLPLLECPGCQKPMSHPGLIGRVLIARRFEDCLRRCEPCGIGASNSAGEPTHIHLDPVRNIPAEARHGAQKVLGRALNVRNRSSKWLRFGYSTSEDAVTWVVFTFLLRTGQLTRCLKQAGVLPAETASVVANVLLWGVPVDGADDGEVLRRRVKDVCTSFGETRTSFSEPDVMIDLGRYGVVIIEVKHRSGNDFKEQTYPGWSKYEASLNKYADFERVRNSGCYELARNWALARGIAEDRPTTLVNLGPSGLFTGGDGERLCAFAAALRSDEQSRFQRLGWVTFLQPILRDAPSWLVDFCSKRGLLPSENHATFRCSGNGPPATEPDPSEAQAACGDSEGVRDLLSLKDMLRQSRKAERTALALDSQGLAFAYERFVHEAPRRRRPYLSTSRDGITSSGKVSSREEEHLAVALFHGKALEMLGEGSIQLADYQFPLKAVQADKKIGKIDLLGVDRDGTLVVIELKVGKSREDRRVGLIEALVYAAVLEANIDPIARELEIHLGREVRRCRPSIVILAPELYWASSDQSALQELEALASGLSLQFGISVRLRSMGARLACLGLNGVKPQLDRPAVCGPVRNNA